MRESAAPEWLRRILVRLLPGPHGDDFLAELDAGFRRRARDGSRSRAYLWYVAQVARLDTVRLIVRLRRRARRTAARRNAARGREPWLVGAAHASADDVRSAVRSLRRNPAHAVLATVTLALGIGATTAMFSAVDTVLLHPFPYEASERMYDFSRPVGRLMYPPTSEQVEVLAAQSDIFEAMFHLRLERPTITGDGPAAGTLLGLSDAETFATLDIEPVIGRTFLPEETAGEGARVVLLAHELWRGRFGSDPGVLGRTVSLNGAPWDVIGVLPPYTRFPNGFESDIDLWGPLPTDRIDESEVVAVARPGTSIDDVQARLDIIHDRAIERGEADDAWRLRAFAIVKRVGGFVAEPLRILMIAVVLVLLIAFVNVANLLLGRAVTRRADTSLRAALGASRARLVRQLLIESVILGGIGAGLGLLAAYGITEVVRALRPSDLAMLGQIHINGRVLLFAMAAGLAGAGLFGTVPAWLGGRPDALGALRSSLALEKRGVVANRSRWLLVCGEVALSFALVVGAVTALRSLYTLQHRDVGFAADEVVFLTPSLPSWEYPDGGMLEEARTGLATLIERHPGVGEVSLPAQPPVVGGFFSSVAPQVEGSDVELERELLVTNTVDEKLHRVLGIPILAGRGFTEDEVRDSASVAILAQQTARRLFGDDSPIGRRFRFRAFGPWYSVVGVAGDVDPASPGAEAGARGLQIYLPTRGSDGAFVVRVAPGYDPDDVLAGLLRELRAEAPNVLFPVATTGRGTMRERAAREGFTSALLATFGGLAILLAVVGLYGVVSGMVGQRTREIGIRVSLGADRGDVRRLVMGHGAGVGAVGVALGAALAWSGLGILSSQILGLDAHGSVGSYAAAAALLAIATLTACWAPARRAMRVDPVRALRQE